MQAATSIQDPVSTAFLEIFERVQAAAEQWPAWFNDYEDLAGDPAELDALLATAPDPVLAALVYGRQAAAH